MISDPIALLGLLLGIAALAFWLEGRFSWASKLGASLLIILFGVFASRPLFRFVHIARLRELNTAFALLIVVGIAFLMILVGLSPALGTFLAGVVLANSEFRHELESDIAPFKGLLLRLFFITVGAGINFAVFLREPFELLGLTLLLMVIKGGVLFLLTLIFRIKGRNRSIPRNENRHIKCLWAIQAIQRIRRRQFHSGIFVECCRYRTVGFQHIYAGRNPRSLIDGRKLYFLDFLKDRPTTVTDDRNQHHQNQR